MAQGHSSPVLHPAVHRLTGMDRHTVTVDGHRLNVFTAGTGPETVVLVPGIPDSSAVYRGQIPGLLEAGYRVIAPDLLGQGDSDLPAEAANYTIAKDQERLWAIVDELGAETFHLVGHDRGAASTWAMAAHRPDRVRSYVALTIGHPGARRYAAYEQRQLSWYMLRLLFSDAEDWLRSEAEGEGGPWSTFRWWVGNHPEADAWIADLERPGAVRAMLNFYRANIHPVHAKISPVPGFRCRRSESGRRETSTAASNRSRARASGSTATGASSGCGAPATSSSSTAPPR
ncbi:alpha/beta hydrolase [Streptomyces olivaceus]|uniref:alpha/beta fold hydrolase n=1 Tax=Streptomyces olivaceus TaxID=47716 RepID=UPI001CCE2F35|nr:alpha/beta hydrolase [Streptomyces olivaceus]MBZ6291164.1 alpha/beta hydrolase [Streptomyces olivaceus]MBZ6325094.1 alpha/beta hydrolase [Streptomyces olivaceus]